MEQRAERRCFREATRVAEHQRRRGRRTSCALVAGLAVLITGCARPQPAEEGFDHVRAVVLPYLSNAVLHVADDDGFFAQQKIDVSFIRLGRNEEIMATLARGHVDVAAGMLTANELNLAAQGARVRVVAGLIELLPEGCAYAAIVARRSLAEAGALERLAELPELTVDASRVTPLGYWIEEALAPQGLTLDDTRMVNLPSPASLESMINGSVDLAADSQPWIDRHLAAGAAVVWRSIGEMLPRYPHAVLMFGPDLLDDRPDVGVRFLRALLAAARKVRLGKTPANLEIVAKATGLDRAQIAATCWPTVPDGLAVDIEAARGYQEWSVRRGISPRVLEPDEIFDFTLLRRARERTGG